MLDQLEGNLNAAKNSGDLIRAPSTQELFSIVRDCKYTLEAIQRKLGKYKDSDLMGKAKFVFAERSITKLHFTLQGHKSTLVIAWLGLV